MLSVLIYCYCTGRFPSRVIEEATYSDVVVRYICGNTHPDHDTICTFRAENRELFEEAFVAVLSMARERGCVKSVIPAGVVGEGGDGGGGRHEGEGQRQQAPFLVDYAIASSGTPSPI